MDNSRVYRFVLHDFEILLCTMHRVSSINSMYHVHNFLNLTFDDFFFSEDDDENEGL